MKSGIYKITNLVNGKFYIGSSNDIEYRWEVEHKGNLRRNQHVNPKLQNAWNFYGENNFKLTIIEETELNSKLLLEKEQYYLDLWQPYQRTIGYNICPKSDGGDNLKHHPKGKEIIQEWKDKYSKLYSGEGNPMFGLKHSEKTIQLQKEKAKGRYTLEWFKERYGDKNGEVKFEERRQMLKNRKINYIHVNGMKGKKPMEVSNEIRKKISEHKLHAKTIKKDLLIDISDGRFTIQQLASKYNLSTSTIKYHRKKIKQMPN